MDFDWSKPFSEAVEGELPDIHIGSDKLDRGKYAEFLTDFLSSLDNQNYVMNLNAEWGAGKTYFLQRWYHTIKEDHPAVYIDAWKHDFSDEPLLAVISAISNYLKSKTPKTGAEKAKNLAEKGWRFSKKVAPELMRGITKKVSGIDITKFGDDEVQTISDLKYDENDTNGAEDFSLFAGKVFEVALADHSEKVNELEFFKSAIQGWLKEVVDSNDDLDLPMFVFIDELDRCRPTYAIELLETVKHVFDIKGFVFVIATDTGQLQHSIKAVYGQDFDSSKYLYRFFNRSFSLQKPALEQFIHSQKIFGEKISKEFQFTCDGNFIFTEVELLNNCSTICYAFGFDLRTTKQWLDRLWSTMNTEGKRKKYIWFYMGILSALKISEPLLFNELFMDNNSSGQFGVDQKKVMIKAYEALFINMGKNKNRLSGSIKNELAREYADTKYPRQISTESKFPCFSGISIDALCELSRLLNIDNPSSVAGKWVVNEHSDYPDPQKLVYMLFHSCKEKYGVEKKDYINMVEMASDLT
ncbi:P-loop NTPase fold protein [Bacterioplanoides sp. SCSIO 12839]|uniref:KAP family P-loop NTPase fold protein n=1 Tax=Bacterioplanoides sp. SCSIO 12839 TaxID=2829569 RepID=UPI002107CBD7|nr:P-loop NTPase fold protein [Bacterioplanoides sp. SCSIO 12839]UTW48332.1 hypothetical protein KFF03_00025 [Bacterioplanoides sp. SCSIO 12839]